MPALTVAGADFAPVVQRNAPTIAQRQGSGGPTYNFPRALLLNGMDFNPAVLRSAPTDAQLEGPGGPEYPFEPTLLVSGPDFNPTVRFLGVTLSLTRPNSALFPRRVRAIVALNDTGATQRVIDWGDGTSNENSLDATHDYEEGGDWLVTFAAINSFNGGLLLDTEEISLPNPDLEIEPAGDRDVPADLGDYTTIPRESEEEVLNLTRGRHGYEHLFAAHNPTSRLMIRKTDRVAASPGEEKLIVEVTPDRDCVVRAIPIDAEADAVFRLVLGGVTQDAIRTTRSLTAFDLLRGSKHFPLPRDMKLAVFVTNYGLKKALFRATVYAEQGGF